MNFFDRVQQLHALLRDRRVPVSGQVLQDELECSRATLHRLIAKLRDELGAPIVYDRDAQGYAYRRDAPFELPGLWFTPQELVALLTIERVLGETGPGWLGEQLSPLREKVRNLLGDQTAGLPDWSNRLRLLSQRARPAGPFFGTVASALARRKRLQLRYRARSRQDARSEREVSPQRLTRYRDNWYLDAWCHWREGLRSFSLDRIDAAELCDVAAIDCSVTELDAALAAGYGIFAGAAREHAELVFSADAARWVAVEQWHPQQQTEWLPGGRFSLRVPYARPEELVADILRHGPAVEVRGPPALRDAVAQAHRAAWQQYATAGDSGSGHRLTK